MNAQKIRRYLIIVILIIATGNFVYQMYLKKAPSKPAASRESFKSAPISAKPTPPSSMITFTDRTYGYSFNYPDSWTLADHSGSNALIRADITDKNLGGLQVRVQKNNQLPLSTFAGQYLENYRKEMLDHWKGDIGMIGQGVEKIGKHEGFQTAMIHNRPDNSKWFLKLFIWLKNDNAFIFQCGAQSGQIHVFEPLFDRCAGSFSIPTEIDR